MATTRGYVRSSRMAVLTFLFTLLAACWWGQALLDLFAITLDSFCMAGGLILLPSACD